MSTKTKRRFISTPGDNAPRGEAEKKLFEGTKIASEGYENLKKRRNSKVHVPLPTMEIEDIRGKTVIVASKHQLTALSPGQIAHIRGKVAAVINDYLPHAAEVLDGSRVWTPVQARVFVALLDKVVPNLSASHSVHEHRLQGVKEMSREQLEAIALGLDPGPAVVDVTPLSSSTEPAQ